jgi:diguanylate cyclase (GGDEF)-like protein
LTYHIVMMAVVTAGLLTGAASQARLVEIARFRNLAEVSNDLLWEFDTRCRLCDLSGRFAKTITWRDSQWRNDWREMVIPQEQDTDFLALESAIRGRQPFQQLVLRVRLPGQEQSLWTLNSGLPLFDDNGEFLGYRGATTDITDYKKAEALRQHAEKLLHDYNQKLESKVAERTQVLAEASQRNWRMANFDSLTGLPNRNLFFEHLRKGLQQARRQWRLAALLLVDLDGFKQVNDTFGHDAGDELLRRIADRLQQCVRTTDTVARLGGDEFTVVLLNLEHLQGAEAVARKMVERLAEPVPLGEASATVTASVGIALYRPEWPDTLDLAMTLLRQADAAMYAAKNAGKNTWRVAEQLGLD